jgi:hypothetical protein
MNTAQTKFQQITSWLGAGQPIPSAWQPMPEQPLLILVGLTGVGKSTTVEALQEAGLAFALLPNRRTLTDALIIPWVQRERGESLQSITDRGERFSYTRAYRQQHPGGMAHVLSQLAVQPDNLAQPLLLFDGLRGENEVTHAANLLPKATFIVLDAPHFVRIQRLLGRQDQFDQMQAMDAAGSSQDLADLGLDQVDDDLLSAAETQQLLALLHSGQINRDDLQAKIQIVLAERRNYDPALTLAALQRHAAERTTVVDTTQYTPVEAAQKIVERLPG